jgi:hypothetical protein
MSEERDGQRPGEDDLDELLGDDEPEGDADEGEELESVEEPEGEGSEEPAAPEPRQQSRAERRIQTLLRRDKDREAELKQLRDAVMRPAQQPVQPQVDPARQAQLDREESERVAQLPYDEQLRYWRTKDREDNRRELLQQQLQTRDMLDRIQFQQTMREKRLPARYENEVESLLTQARQQGMNPSREWLLKAAIGNEVLTKKDRETEKQRTRGQRRIASQTTRPGGGTRSTAASPGGRRREGTAADDEALLRGITIGEFENL